MNPLKIIKVLNKIEELLNKIIERPDLKEKFEKEGISGKLHIEDVEILFLIKKGDGNA